MSDDDAGDPVQEALARAATLPAEAIERLFARYGRPLAAPPPPPPPAEPLVQLRADDGRAAQLRRVRLRMPVDVIANDFFVLEAEGAEPLAIAGPLFAAALAALARALARAE